MPAIDERRVAVLEAIVRGYVRDGEPVGSKRIAEESGLGVSAATHQRGRVLVLTVDAARIPLPSLRLGPREREGHGGTVRS
jgi:hypothetical protein